MNKLIRFIDSLAEYTGRVISWATLAMVLITFVVVVLRYFFDIGWIAMQESITYLHAVVFMLGAAFTLKHQGHVRVDIFQRNMSARSKAWVDLLGSIFLLLPVCVFIFWISWRYVGDSWRVLEGSREAGGIPGVFLLKSLILLFPFTLVLQATAIVLKNIQVIRGQANG